MNWLQTINPFGTKQSGESTTNSFSADDVIKFDNVDFRVVISHCIASGLMQNWLPASDAFEYFEDTLQMLHEFKNLTSEDVAIVETDSCHGLLVKNKKCGYFQEACEIVTPSGRKNAIAVIWYNNGEPSEPYPAWVNEDEADEFELNNPDFYYNCYPSKGLWFVHDSVDPSAVVQCKQPENRDLCEVMHFQHGFVNQRSIYNKRVLIAAIHYVFGRVTYIDKYVDDYPLDIMYGDDAFHIDSLIPVTPNGEESNRIDE